MVLDVQFTDPTRPSYRPLRVAPPATSRRRKRARQRTVAERKRAEIRLRRSYEEGGTGWWACFLGVQERFLCPFLFHPPGTHVPVPRARSVDALGFAAGWAEWDVNYTRRKLRELARMEVPDGEPGRTCWSEESEAEAGAEEGGPAPTGGAVGHG